MPTSLGRSSLGSRKGARSLTLRMVNKVERFGELVVGMLGSGVCLLNRYISFCKQCLSTPLNNLTSIENLLGLVTCSEGIAAERPKSPVVPSLCKMHDIAG